MKVCFDVAGHRLRSVDLGRAPLLGEGGEAKVFHVDDMAVKIFHAAMAGGPSRGADAAQVREKEMKVDALLSMSLPGGVIRPIAKVLSPRGAFVGYVMPRCEGAIDAGELLRPRGRPAAFTLADACALLRRLHTLLAAAHREGVVVGDLNDGNVLVRKQDVFLIDVDSFQVPSATGEVLHCRVAHEKYLDPRLYGVDLASHTGVFSAESDWYAFAVFAFQLLTLVHPYGGVVDNIPTLLRRAEAMHSALRDDVRLPKIALPSSRLPTALVDFFWSVFEGDHRGPFPCDLLRARWTQCRCGVEHARSLCPTCGGAGAPPLAKTRIKTLGTCTEETLLAVRPNEKIVAVDAIGRLRVVVESMTAEGEHRFTDAAGREVYKSRGENRRPYFVGADTWVAGPNHAEALAGTGGDTFALDAAPGSSIPFAVASGQAFGVTSGVVWNLSQKSVVGRCMEGRTQLFGGGQMVLGFYRLDETLVLFTHRVGEAGVSDTMVRVPRGALVESSVAFDPLPQGHALVTLVWNVGGKLVSQWLVVDDRARVVAQRETSLLDGEAGAVATGRCLFQGVLLVAEDAGLTTYRRASASNPFGVVPLVVARTFSEAAPFVDPSVQLIPDGQGGLVVMRPQSITRLTLR